MGDSGYSLVAFIVCPPRPVQGNWLLKNRHSTGLAGLMAQGGLSVMTCWLPALPSGVAGTTEPATKVRMYQLTLTSVRTLVNAVPDRHSRPRCHVAQVLLQFTSTETVGLLGTGAQVGHLTFTQLLSSVGVTCRSVVKWLRSKWEQSPLMVTDLADPGLRFRFSQFGPDRRKPAALSIRCAT